MAGAHRPRPDLVVGAMEVHLPRARDEALGDLAETHGVRRCATGNHRGFWGGTGLGLGMGKNGKNGAYPTRDKGDFSEHDDEAMDLANGFSDKPKWSIERGIMMNHDEPTELGAVAYFAD